MRRVRTYLIGLVVLAALTVSTSALAAGGGLSTQQGYPSPTVHTVSAQSTLPFTGIDLGAFVLVALALIAGGLVLRASGRKAP